MSRESPPKEREIRLAGVFDDAAANAIREALQNVHRGERLRVDLTGVQQFEEFGFAVLAQALASSPGVDVEVAGLLEHQVRVLRYLGVAPEVFAISSVGVVH